MANIVEIIINGKNMAGPALLEAEKQLETLGKTATAIGRPIRNVGAAMTAGITVPLGAMIVKSTMAAARVDELDIVIEQLGKSAGFAEGELEGHVEAVRDMGIEAGASREIIARFVTAQLDSAQAADLARIAQDQAVIAGENSTETMSRLTDALITGNAQMFRTLGMSLDLGDAYDVMAQSLGKSTAELTEAEKVQARVNAVMQYGTTIVGTYEAAMGDSFKQMGSFKRYLDDIFVTMGQYFTPALNDVVFAVGDLLKAIPDLISEGGALAPVMEDWSNAASKAAGFITKFTETLKDMDPALLQTAGQLVGLTAVIGPLLLVGGQMLIWLGKVTTALGVIAPALGMTKVAMLGTLGPIGAVAAGLMALGTAYTYAWNKSKLMNEGIASAKDEAIKSIDTYDDYVTAMKELGDETSRTVYFLEDGERVFMAGSEYIAAMSESAWEAARAHQALQEGMLASDEHMVRMAGNAIQMTGELGSALEGLPDGVGVEIDIETEQAMAALQDLQDKMENDLSRSMEVLVSAQQSWKDSLAADLVAGLEDAGLEGDAFVKRLEAIDKALGTDLTQEHLYNVEYALEMPELLQTLLDNPQKFVEEAAVFVDYFMPLEESVRKAQEAVDALQADLDELAKEYDAIINVTQVGDIPELKDQSATYTINVNTPGLGYFQNYIGNAAGGVIEGAFAAGGAVQAPDKRGMIQAAAGYWVGEVGPEPFFPEQNGRIISNTEATRALRESRGGGGNTVNVTINTPFNFADSAWVERELDPYIRKAMREALRA